MDTQGTTLNQTRPTSVRKIQITREGAVAAFFVSCMAYLAVIYPCLQ